MLSGTAVPEKKAVERDGFDFITIPILYAGDSNMPVNFGGMSGGGLWQILIKTGPSGRIETDK